MVTFQSTEDLSTSAEMTYTNMRLYYQYYGVDWQADTIKQKIASLVNFDILSDERVIGAIRLETIDDCCYLRDLQVIDSYQNKGIGGLALNEVKRLAIGSGANILRLKVFKMSPAYHLYKRLNFLTEQEDDKFYHMACHL
ncbi:GNAT family N-acetyltransferase [Vibrio aquimaris]|uniref:Acetyltransferase (GNAT) family protein n=1 Tax=Vibrio aquimaris TaxID=2587862 RepID=A0A5P9CKE8_9VIBR|nr:GNAT family N-acetyltransferase [Vibrio aquimaris]QFT26403.1 Acetyltransferase (GNAT) family protein [Vibrio aquimaris]